VSELNRKTQAEFVCQLCGFVGHADVNAAQNIAERFSDDELNQLPFRDVKALLEQRFKQRLSPDARSASAGLDT
jgi:transposase